MKKISVIGAGLGGLSASIRLAHIGYDVDVYERNSEPGGKARSLNINGFRFDTGPSLLTMPFVINELFESVGEDINQYLSINKLDVLCKYFYPDNTIINAYSDKEKFIQEIEAKTNENGKNLLRYLDYCRRIYELTSDIFLFNNLYSISSYVNVKALKTLFRIGKIDSSRTMDEANRSFFDDARIVQLFNRYATYNGSNPYQCPATLNIISHVEYNLGGYFIDGGMFKLTEALYKLALKKGVKFHLNSDVTKIEIKNNKVIGIVTSEKFIETETLISNSDVYSTYGKLLNDKHSRSAKKYDRLEPSSSALVFYWGVNVKSDNLEIHNILFSKNYKKEFNELFNEKSYPTDPTIYIYISSKFANSDAPESHENWFVMINAPYRDNTSDLNYNQIKEKILQKIKNVTGYDIKDKIICEKIMTPADIEQQTGSYKGSIYGISSNSRKSAFLRQPNKSKEYDGLYFCGGSAHPGGGIPLVILSGKICSDLISNNK